MKTGIELITAERQEQIEKHGISVSMDIDLNKSNQLTDAASKLAYEGIDDIHGIDDPPEGWDIDIWQKMICKTYKDRLIIAGALIAAEIDRIQALE